MAQTVLKVTNLNPDFPFVDGFWLTAQSDGGLDRNTPDDGTDDVVVSPTRTLGNDKRGTWVWLNGENTTIDGIYTDSRSNAGMLYNALMDKSFYWNPKNPEYNSIAPNLKDGSVNPDFNGDSNPLAHGEKTIKVKEIGESCQHFLVEVVLPIPTVTPTVGSAI